MLGTFSEAIEKFRIADEIYKNINVELRRPYCLAWWGIALLRLGNIQEATNKIYEVENIL